MPFTLIPKSAVPPEPEAPTPPKRDRFGLSPKGTTPATPRVAPDLPPGAPRDPWTLRALRDWVDANKDAGVCCPVCDHLCRVYPRVLNCTTVRSLCWLVRAAWGEVVEIAGGGFARLPLEGDFVDVPRWGPTYVLRTNQHPTLRWWRLAERAPNDDKKKRDSGLWRPTELGIAFAEGRILIPRRVFHYHGDAVGYGDEMTSIMGALGANFDYSAVMARPAPGAPVEYEPFRWEPYPPRPLPGVTSPPGGPP